MKKLNITSVYTLTSDEGIKTFFFTVKSPRNQNLDCYSYYLLSENDENVPQITRVNHAINLLQAYGPNIKVLDSNSPDYDSFILNLAESLRPNFMPQTLSDKTEKQLKKIHTYDAKQIPKKK